jgi:hypothetical protein
MFKQHRRSIYEIDHSAGHDLSRFIDERTSRFNVCVIVCRKRCISSRDVLYMVTLSIPVFRISDSTFYICLCKSVNIAKIDGLSRTSGAYQPF